MKPVSDEVVNRIRDNGKGSIIFTAENLQTLKDNRNQWYEMASTVGNDNYNSVMASYVSSARYFRDKLKASDDIDIEFKSSQSRKDKSARLYVRVIGDTNNGTD